MTAPAVPKTRWWVTTAGLLPLLLVVMLVAAAWVGLRQPWASAQLLKHLPGVEVSLPEGALWGDFKAARVTVQLPRGGQVVLEQLVWQGLRLAWDETAPWGVAVEADRLAVQRLTLDWVPDPAAPASTPLQAPTTLALPVSVRLGALSVVEAHSALWGPEPLRDVRLSLQAMVPSGFSDTSGASGAFDSSEPAGATHRLVLDRLDVQGWRLQGQATVGAASPLPVALKLNVSQVIPTPGQPGLALNITGPLADLQAQATARWVVEGEQSPSTLNARAQLLPFAPWPLVSAQAELDAVNPAGLAAAARRDAAGWPLARLSGRVSLQADAQGPGTLTLALRNAPAGAWDAQRLPLQALSGEVSWQQRPGQVPWRTWVLDTAVDLELTVPGWRPSSERSGESPGVIRLQGRPQDADGLVLSWDGFNPRGVLTSAPDVRSQARLALRPRLTEPEGLAVRGEVQGVHGRGAAARPVSLSLEASYAVTAAGQLLEVTRLSTRTGQGSGEFRDVRVTLAEGQPWKASGQVVLQALDPSVWLPWPVAARGRHALTGNASFDLDAQWRGQASLRMERSLLADVPLQATVDWRSDASSVMSLSAQADLGGNRLDVDGRVPLVTNAQGAPTLGTRWTLKAQWQMDALEALQPWAVLAGAEQLSGRTQGNIALSGQWPQWVTSGQATVQALLWRDPQATTVSVPQAEARWDWQGHEAASPVELQLQARGLNLQRAGLGDLKVPELDVSAQGEVGQHRARWQVRAELPSERTWSLSGGVQGGFEGLAGAQPAWRGALQQVRVLESWMARRAGRSAETQQRSWLVVDDLPWRWQRTAQHDRIEVSAADLNTAGLTWRVQQARWQRPRGALQAADGVPVDALTLQAQLMPWRVAPWLQQLQPQVGWAGDLELEGGVSIVHTPEQPWQVQAHLQRREGDLQIIEQAIQGGQAQRLGIRDARIELSARQGVWTLTQRFNGRVLGDVQARQQLTARPAHRLPDVHSPLSGELAFNAPSLRPWGNWLPAGWRLGGKLQAWAALGGSLAEPRLTGGVRGEELSASQLLTGVSLSDGRLSMVLDGSQVRLDELMFADGQGGQLRLSGLAELGEQPQATLDAQLQRFTALQRIDRRLRLSGGVQARLQGDDVTATGQLKVDEGLFDISRSDAPTIGDDVRVVNRPGESDDTAEASGDGATERRADIQIGIDLGQRLRIRGRGLEATLQGALQLTTPNNRPSLTGTVTVKDGVYAAYGQRLVIDRGGITFTGPIENPRLDLRAMRAQSPAARADDVKVGVTITGTAQDPRIRLYSEPSMSETEKLSWLLLGRAPSGLDGADIGLLQTAAVALLSGESGGPSESLVQRLGLDELSVRQTDGTVRETVVNLGKQLSERWYLGYERNLNATTGNWQLIYRAAQRFTLRAQAGDDNALDLIWQFRWNGRAKPQTEAP